MSKGEKKKLILVTTYFPPIQSIACNRMLAFAKYIDKTKYEFHIVTLESNILQKVEIPGAFIHRIKNQPAIKMASFTKPTYIFIRRLKSLYNKIYNYYNFLPYRNWQNQCVQKVKEILGNSSDSIIVSSYAPVEAHLVPLKLKNEGFSFKWIADFRDEMSLNPYNQKRWENKIKKIEQEILQKIDGLSTISDIFIERFKKLSENNTFECKEVRNGFDFEYNSNCKPFFNPEFTINYVGNIYSTIDLTSFYEAISNLNNKSLIPDLKINFIGVGKSFRLPKKYSHIVKLTDKFPHSQAIEKMKSSDALLFILPNIGWTGVYSGKLFEYLGSRRPIIALTDPKDVAAKLIMDCNAGFVADFKNVEEIESVFLQAYQLWKNKQTLNYNDDLINQHHRKNQVVKLQELIDIFN